MKTTDIEVLVCHDVNDTSSDPCFVIVVNGQMTPEISIDALRELRNLCGKAIAQTVLPGRASAACYDGAEPVA